MNNQLKTKHILSVALVILSATAILALNGQFASALEDHEITTVMVLPATGGTTNLGSGSFSYANNTVLTTTAIPDAGYEFLYWNVTGIMNTEGEHDSMGTDTSDMEHGGPFGELSDLDSLILTDKSIDITIDCAYTYQYQAFFAPNQNASPSSTSSISNQQTASGDNTTLYIAIGVIGGIAAVSAVAGLYIKGKKKPVAPIAQL